MTVVENCVGYPSAAKNLWVTSPLASTVQLADLLERYAREVSPTKRGAAQESYKLRKIGRSWLGEVAIHELTGDTLARYRDDRLSSATLSTVRQELSMIRRTLDAARLAWGYSSRSNPAEELAPLAAPLRDRRGSRNELAAITAHLDPVATAAVRLIMATGMNLSRLLALRWEDTRSFNASALAALEGLQAASGPIFPVRSHTLRRTWQKACATAQVEDLQLRDLTRGYAEEAYTRR